MKPYSKLDFSHLWSVRVGYARHRSVQRGERYAYPTGHDDTSFSPLRATVFRTSLATCADITGRRNPRSGQTDGEFGLTRYGFGSTEAIPSLPPGIEPRRLVEQGSEPYPAGTGGGSLRARRSAAGCGRRRDPGAPPGKEDRGEGHLP